MGKRYIPWLNRDFQQHILPNELQMATIVITRVASFAMFAEWQTNKHVAPLYEMNGSWHRMVVIRQIISWLTNASTDICRKAYLTNSLGMSAGNSAPGTPEFEDYYRDAYVDFLVYRLSFRLL
jgi:hypothetical protein